MPWWFISVTSTRLLTSRPLVRHYSQNANSLPAPPRIRSLVTPEDMSKAQRWTATFKDETIPRALVELSFSRSSGPGGQNVNKVNTKATLRCSLNSSWIPIWAHSSIKEDPHYAFSTDCIFIQSSVHRSQAQNIEECISKLHNLVLTAASEPIREEPSEEQKNRVAALERADKARRRQDKSYRSEVKRNRSKGDWD